jgi:hypothetical protein
VRAAEGIVQTLTGDLEDERAVYWKGGQPQKPDPSALEKDYGWRLWEISAQMTGLSSQKDDDDR